MIRSESDEAGDKKHLVKKREKYVRAERKNKRGKNKREKNKRGKNKRGKNKRGKKHRSKRDE